MGYITFLVCMVLEFCPIKEWNWDFGMGWFGVLLVLMVQIAIDVTRAQSRPEK